MKTWLKRFAKLLLVLLLLIAVALVAYVYQSFPTLNGEVKLTGLLGDVSIRRDQSDVTHIEANHSSDVWRAIGYTHAQERSWQLEFNRRLMHGELSEILGSATLETDKLLRTLGIIRAAKVQYANYPADVKAALGAYADGINGFYASSKQALPPEFHILGIKPSKWEATDSVGWGLMMALDLGGNWGAEFARLAALQKLSTQELWQLMPAYEGEAPATQLDLAKLYKDWGVFIKPTSQPKSSPQALLGKDINDWATGLGHVDSRGSNSWVISGTHTESGKPLLANDPHLGLSAPAIWYFARLKSSDFDAIGATLPGLPFVILGRTHTVAWGFTNTGPDTQDLYLEQIDPANAKQYRTPTGWGAFLEREEMIKVKKQADVKLIVRSTRHGPVVSDAQSSYDGVLNKSKYAISLRWAALDADNLTLVAGYNGMKAKTVGDLEQAFSLYHSPMQNMVMADTNGQMLYKAVGVVPLRAANDDIKGMSPSLGWEAKYDWTGWLRYTHTPEMRDFAIRKKGWLATANQKIHPDDYPYFMGQDWAQPYRHDRIDVLLAQTPKHTVKSVGAIQADTVSASTKKVLPSLLAVQSEHPMAAAALAQLKNFDGNMTTHSVAATLVNVWRDELAKAVLGDKLGSDTFKLIYGKRQFRQGMEEMLAADQGKGNQAWCAPQTCTERYTAAFDATLDKLGKQYGRDLSLWTWGTVHPAISSHRPFSSVPVLKRLFTVSTPSAGDPTTVNVGQYFLTEIDQPYANRHAASLRAIYDLADLEKSQFIYQTGQSGLVFSSRYKDMANEWSSVEYRKLQMNTNNFVTKLKLIP
ncbi:MAG: penicillin acylase family protein [Cytophagales bacterium]|nr:penicillin acylase family protein [Cytophagales bacterium]